ncbi:serine/threonine protein kinase [Humibacter sp. BT305]|nr:serine/threonine protein kinase [Humibacter sp. BT305]
MRARLTPSSQRAAVHLDDRPEPISDRCQEHSVPNVSQHAHGHTVSERYLLHTTLGTGGMASVYQASDAVLGREVAVKVFSSEGSTAAERIDQEREIHLLAQLAHPSLVSVYDAGAHSFDGGEARRFVVMELASDRTLRDLLKSGPLSGFETAVIGAQIADGLAYVHSRSIVHRDVKPANILLTDNAGRDLPFVAKLTDFGIAQFVDGSRFTVEGAVIGTASYLSPEQAKGDALTTASDVYSLGLVLLEAMTGERAFPGTLIESATARIFKDADVPSDLPPEWQELLTVMTSRDPSARPSAEAVTKVLRSLQAETTTIGDTELSTAELLELSEPPASRREARARQRRFRAKATRQRQTRALVVGSVAVGVAALCALSWLIGVLSASSVIGG